jgi:hypothetical protein
MHLYYSVTQSISVVSKGHGGLEEACYGMLQMGAEWDEIPILTWQENNHYSDFGSRHFLKINRVACHFKDNTGQYLFPKTQFELLGKN